MSLVVRTQRSAVVIIQLATELLAARSSRQINERENEERDVRER